MGPILRSFCDELGAGLLRILAHIGGIAVLVVVVAKFYGVPLVITASAPSPPDRLDLARPFRAFAPTMPDVSFDAAKELRNRNIAR